MAISNPQQFLMGVECKSSDDMRILVEIWRGNVYLSNLVWERGQSRGQSWGSKTIITESQFMQVRRRKLPVCLFDSKEIDG